MKEDDREVVQIHIRNDVFNGVEVEREGRGEEGRGKPMEGRHKKRKRIADGIFVQD